MNFGHNGSGALPVANELQSLFHQPTTFRTVHKVEVYGVAAVPRNLPISGGTEQ